MAMTRFTTPIDYLSFLNPIGIEILTNTYTSPIHNTASSTCIGISLSLHGLSPNTGKMKMSKKDQVQT